MIPFLLLLAAVVGPGGLPQPDGLPTVPGVVNPAVTQANIHRTICVSGWSKRHRPTYYYTSKIKFALLRREHILHSESYHYELDHVISIELGGSPTSVGNLFLQPYFGPRNAHQKDAVEDLLHSLVCHGKLSLAEAQKEVWNWPTTYQQRIGKLP